jgi:threonine/homoserine/homoserine lactone efflux protein
MIGVFLDIGILARAVSLGFTAAISPGPFQTYVIAQTLSHGWRRGLPLIIAPLISDIPIAILALFVLRQLPDTVLQLIRIAGGLFLLYLAWGMFRQLRQKTSNSASGAAGTTTNALRRTVLMNLVSPGPYIFWFTITGPMIVGAWGRSPADAVAFVVGFYAVFMGGMAVYVAVFHQARRLDERIVRGLLLTGVVVMVVLGLLLLRAGFFGA